MKLLRLLAALLFAGVSACSSLPHPQADDPANGILVLGYRWVNAPPVGFAGLTMWLKVFDPATGTIGHKPGSLARGAVISIERSKNDEVRYRFIALEPGTYVIDHLDLDAGPHHWGFSCNPMSFTIEAGKVSYIGDFDVERTQVIAYRHDEAGARAAQDLTADVRQRLSYQQPVRVRPDHSTYAQVTRSGGLHRSVHPCSQGAPSAF